MIRISDKLVSKVVRKAGLSPRKRCNYNFHKSYNDKLQRLLNAANPGTYVRAHKHEKPDKAEVFIILRGRVLIVEFDARGGVRDSYILDPKKGSYGVEIPPRAWHTLICLERGSCLYELKSGPYHPKAEKKFATWAPEEGTKAAGLFNQKIISYLLSYA